MPKYAYAGLGNMGIPISAHLASYAKEHGDTLAVWNRSQDKYDSLRESLPGATFATSLKDLADADVVFMSVLNDAAAIDVTEQLFAVLAKGAIVVDQSSVNPTTSKKIDASAKEKGIHYLAAPVFGRPDAAAAGQLVQVLAGDKEAKARVRDVADVWSKAVLDLGDEVYKGTTIKLMGNGLIVGLMETLAETYALGEAVGIEPEVFQQFVGLSLTAEMFFPTPSYKAYGRKIGQGNFNSDGGFRLEGGLKDARNMLNVGADLGHPVPMPVIQIAKEHMERAQELGGPDLDWSSLSAAVREKAGLPPFRQQKE